MKKMNKARKVTAFLQIKQNTFFPIPTMVLFSFLVFSPSGDCVFSERYRDTEEREEEDNNLLSGLLKTLKKFCAKIAHR
jgi:hypothetical protein